MRFKPMFSTSITRVNVIMDCSVNMFSVLQLEMLVRVKSEGFLVNIFDKTGACVGYNFLKKTK